MPDSYREKEASDLRVLFCFGVSQNFFDADEPARAAVVEACKSAFADLLGRFGINVLGTMDDDELMVGPSQGWPWTCYILADVPNLETVLKVTTLVRDWEVGSDRLWRYLRVEARIGRKLFFGND